MSYHASYRSETHCMHVCACVRARAREILTWFRLRGAVMGRSSRDNGFAGSNGIWLARKIDSIVARDPGETFYGSAFIAEFIPPGYWISRPRVSGLKPACANTENTWRRGEAHNGLAAHVSPRGFFFFSHPTQSIGLFNRLRSCLPVFRRSPFHGDKSKGIYLSRRNDDRLFYYIPFSVIHFFYSLNGIVGKECKLYQHIILEN